MNREAELWQVAQDQDDIASYQAYLDAFPDGEYKQQAAKQLKILNFKKNRPKTSPSKAKKVNDEEADWVMVRDAHTPEMYRKYLVKYPQGEFKDLAYNLIEAFEAGLNPPKPTSKTEEKTDALALRPSSGLRLVRKSVGRLFILLAFVLLVWWLFSKFLF